MKELRIRALLFGPAAVVLLLIGQLAANPVTSPNGHLKITYTVKHAGFAPPVFHVTAEVSGIKTPTIDLTLPAYVPGVPSTENFAKNTSRFKVTDPLGERLRTNLVGKQTWRVFAEGAEQIKVEFDYAANTLGPAHAKIAPNFAIFSGYNLFLLVEGYRNNPSTVRFEAPAGWRVISALNETKDPQVYFAPDYETLAESPALMVKADQFDTEEFEVMGKKHQMIFTPANTVPKETRAKYVDLMVKIIKVQGAMFGSLPYDKYTFFYLVMDPERSNIMEYLNSCVVFIDAAGNPMSNGFTAQSAHAFFHTWNFRRFRPAEEWARDYTHEPLCSLYWVGEGFGNYFANQTRVRSGIISRAQFVKNVQNAIESIETNENRHYLSPVDVSLSSWYRYAGGIPSSLSIHEAGNMLAALLDLSIIHDTKGASNLDDVVRSLNNDYYLKGKGYSLEDLITVISGVTKCDYRDFFRRHVQGVDVPPYDKILGYAGYKLEKITIKIPSLGFRLEQSPEGSRVAAIVPNSHAAKSELAAGDVIVSVDGMDAPRTDQGIAGLREWLTPKVDQTIKIVVKRKGETKEVDMKLGYREQIGFRIVEVPSINPEQQKMRDWWVRASK